ncbi:MAG: head GIN domain-containing protein [Flavobacterium haoranii]
MNKIIYILLFIITTSCGISEDCLSGNGSKLMVNYPLEGFTKVKVYSGVGLVVKEGSSYEVRIETRDNIKDNIEVSLNGDMLIVKDNSTCNIARDYGLTIVYVTTPNLEEIHCKTEQNITSDGVLNFPNLKLYSLEDDGDGAGTGNFYLDVNIQDMMVETNSVTNFYLKGHCHNIHITFSWGDARFEGQDLIVTNHLSFFHRGTNDMILFPTYTFGGNLYSTGNVIIKNPPLFDPDVVQHYTGRLILDY